MVLLYQLFVDVFGLDKVDTRSQSQRIFEANLTAFVVLLVLLLQAFIWFAGVYQICSWIRSGF